MKGHLLLFIPFIAAAISCHNNTFPHTKETKSLIRQMTAKLDSTDIYTQRKEARIMEIKSGVDTADCVGKYNLYYDVARAYMKYISDSSLLYFNKASRQAEEMGRSDLKINAEISRSNMLSITGFYTEAQHIIMSIPRNTLDQDQMVAYYNAMTSLYHGLYSSNDEPRDFKDMYRKIYTVYRDSLLAIDNPENDRYLRNLEKKAAREGNYDEARRYNALRREKLSDPKSDLNATRLYDSYAINYVYENKPSGEAIDDLIRSAMIEMENCNQDIASLLKLEIHLVDMGEVSLAKKISDYYYRSMRKFGSRSRRIAASDQAVHVNNHVLLSLHRRNNAMILAFIFISILLVIITVSLVKINQIRKKVTILNEKLMHSGEITKGYIGVMFKLYSSYIKRLETFRSKIHLLLKKGNTNKALELTSLSGYVTSDEVKELYYNFDSVFLDIFPDFVDVVNSCLKEESRITKHSNMLTTELRIIALTKLGIEDANELAELLRCSVKTIYNLRSGFKTRLAIKESDFKKIIAEM